LQILWLIPALPFAGFFVLALFGKRIGRGLASVVGVGSIGLSAVLSIITAINYISRMDSQAVFVQTLWRWINVAGLDVSFSLHLDSLSLLMTLVVTVVGFLIHWYSSAFMADDEGFSRFFAYMNLFVGFMLLLVLAENLLLLVVGWEGVGLCSYLLIGFWYTDPANGLAARKAFVMTRIGDAAFLVAIYLLYRELGTLNIQAAAETARASWSVGSPVAVLIALLILGGAVGKSAQLPLQTWLPDAMAGPTPTSALIHAATMVTAGVYLIARMHRIFELAPAASLVTAIVGAATLLLAGFSALAQKDIKRVLAYSTISQIGYMFLALGVGAYTAAMFHFMTHAFFKALLFLGAGVIIISLHHEHNIFKMGGLKKLFPVTYWTFLIGCASLSAFPLVTAGFYSKDKILWAAWASPGGSPVLWLAGLIGALITGLYTFRMFFIAFHGEPHARPEKSPSAVLLIPLVVLAVFSVAGGFVELPETMGHFAPFSELMRRILPATGIGSASVSTEFLFQLLASVAGLGGILAAFFIYYIGRREVSEIDLEKPGRPLYKYLFYGFGFDFVYERLLSRPYYWLARINRSDFIDKFYYGLARLNLILNRLISASQTGRVRNYALGIALGAVLITILVVLK
jgi:NADH-quinone oxidoreductase subunit L